MYKEDLAVNNQPTKLVSYNNVTYPQLEGEFLVSYHFILLCEFQTPSSSNWNRVTVSISYDNNHENTSAPINEQI